MVRSSCLKRSCKVVLCLAWGLPLWFGIGHAASAADPSFVGVLALAVDKDVADRLGLSDEARGRLRQLVNEREDAALEIVLSIKDLPPMEQTTRLTPFVEESERLGFALLTVAQREKLRQIRLAREGMSALAEPGLSEALNLSGEQKTVVQKLLDQRAVDLTKGGESERRITRAVYERKLASILTDSQRATWETLSGLSDAPSASVPVAAAKPASESTPVASETEKPATSTPAAATAETEKPVAPPPAAVASEAEKPAMTTPAATTAETAKPAVPPPATVASETEKPAMTTPAATTAEAAKPAVPPPAAVASEAEKARDDRAGSSTGGRPRKPAVPPPAAVASEAEKPAMTPPAATTAEAAKPAAPPPAAVASEAEKPAMAAPATATAETAKPAAPPPAAVASEAEKPAMTTPATATAETEKPAAPPPAAVASEAESPTATPATSAAGNGELRFQFDAAPWKDVLEWLAAQSGLSLAIETLPVGSFTYRDDRTYTLDEALDLLNSYLLTKGYTLIRRERILLVVDVENPIPDELVTLVTTEELDKRGRFELVKCLFPLAKMKAEDAAAMIKDFIGPQGKVIPFPKARQILVTETAGKLRTIRDMISRVEDPTSGAAETVAEFNLQHASSEEFLSIARPLLGIPEGQNSGTEISLSVDLLGTRIFAAGNPDKLQLLRDLLTKIDKAPNETGKEVKEPEQLKLATYFIKSADSQVVLRSRADAAGRSARRAFGGGCDFGQDGRLGSSHGA